MSRTQALGCEVTVTGQIHCFQNDRRINKNKVTEANIETTFSGHTSPMEHGAGIEGTNGNIQNVKETKAMNWEPGCPGGGGGLWMFPSYQYAHHSSKTVTPLAYDYHFMK